MTTTIKYKIIEDLSRIFFIGILVAAGTFPNYSLNFGPGIDPSLKWVYNFIFQHGLIMGKGIIFPHGPLAFFMYPLGENLILATVVIFVLKTFLVANVAWLYPRRETKRWLVAFTFAFMLSIIAGFMYLVLANIILLYCNYFNQERNVFKILAFILTAFACYVKSYIGVISGLLYCSFILYYLIKDRDFKKAGIDVLIFMGLLLSLWFLLYRTLSGFINYFTGLFHLALDNSSAASFYPENNWWVLVPFLVIAFSMPFFNRTPKSMFYGMLTTLSIFAAWKHGMAREDIYHTDGFVIYLTTIFVSFILFDHHNSFRNLVLSIIAMFLIIINAQNVVAYKPMKYELVRLNNFIELVSDFSVRKSKASEVIRNNISSKKLPQFIRDSIGINTVDVYPWDYSIIAANSLNWRPRIVIQSYAAYTHWLDGKDADHFNSQNAPEFIIWDLEKSRPGRPWEYKFPFISIDNRYLLNDEPQTIVQILRNYSWYYNDTNLLIIKKRQKSLSSNKYIIAKDHVTWGQWIKVPGNSKGLLRAKLSFNKSFSQRVKSFLYKDEEFWIMLKFKDGAEQKYKIVPENAADGIWINPFLVSLTKTEQVQRVMINCSDPAIMVKDLTVEWEVTEFENSPGCVFDFFNIMEISADTASDGIR